MKNFYVIMAVVFGLLLSTSCSNDTEGVVVPEPTEQMSIVANLGGDNTKTTITPDGGGFKVDWCQGDVLTISDSEKDQKWDFTWLADNKFVSSSAMPAGTYKLHAAHVDSDNRTRVSSKTHVLHNVQTQSGNANLDHINDLQCIYGHIADDVTLPSETPLTFEMKQLYSIIHFRVVNTRSTPMTVSSIKLTVDGADIAGTFAVDYSCGSTTCSDTKDNITLNITHEPIAVGDTLNAYMMVNAVAMSGKTGKIEVVINGATCKITKTFPAGMQAGKVYRTSLGKKAEYVMPSSGEIAANSSLTATPATTPVDITLSAKSTISGNALELKNGTTMTVSNTGNTTFLAIEFTFAQAGGGLAVALGGGIYANGIWTATDPVASQVKLKASGGKTYISKIIVHHL